MSAYLLSAGFETSEGYSDSSDGSDEALVTGYLGHNGNHDHPDGWINPDDQFTNAERDVWVAWARRLVKEPWATLHAVANPPELGLALICAELSEAGSLPSGAELDLIAGATWEQIAEEITNEVDDIFNELTGTRDSLHPSVLVRSDTEDLVRLVEAADSASLFSRGRHRKALEAALGPDAATNDRKALHAAVRTALTVAPRVLDVRRRVAEELRINMPSNWSPMAVDATEVFSSLLGQVRAIAEEVESAALREFMAHLTVPRMCTGSPLY